MTKRTKGSTLFAEAVEAFPASSPEEMEISEGVAQRRD